MTPSSSEVEPGVGLDSACPHPFLECPSGYTPLPLWELSITQNVPEPLLHKGFIESLLFRAAIQS
jgi:hypothetical protein